MTVVVRCPNPDCRANSTAADSLRGNTVTCKKCGQRFVVNPTRSGELSDGQTACFTFVYRAISDPASGLRPLQSVEASWSRGHGRGLSG
jgi:hypothetical protein